MPFNCLKALTPETLLWSVLCGLADGSLVLQAASDTALSAKQGSWADGMFHAKQMHACVAPHS